MPQYYEAVPLQVPLPQVLKQEFELKIEGDGADRSPLQGVMHVARCWLHTHGYISLQGRLGLEPCTWPVKAIFTPTKDNIDIRWIELSALLHFLSVFSL
jgi:hypothetical protein